VALLLIPLQGNRLGQKGVLLDQAESLDFHGGRRLGSSRLVPDRESPEPGETLVVEVGPDDVSGPERVVRVDEKTTEEAPVLLASDDQAPHAS